MAQFVVNIVQIAAILVLIVSLAAMSISRRRCTRRGRDEQCRLILQAIAGGVAPPAAVPAPIAEHEHLNDHRAAVPTSDLTPLDAASVTVLVELLENRQPHRRGMIAGLVASPRTVWAAGQRVGHHGMAILADTGPERELYRAGPAELVDMNVRDPLDAHGQHLE